MGNLENIEEETKKAEAKMPMWIEKGNKVIRPEKRAIWEKCVDYCVHNFYYLYHDSVIKCSLEALTALHEGKSFGDCKKIIYKYEDPGVLYRSVIDIIVNLYDKGPAFFRFMNPEEAKEPKTKAYLERIEEENAELNKNEKQPTDV